MNFFLEVHTKLFYSLAMKSKMCKKEKNRNINTKSDDILITKFRNGGTKNMSRQGQGIIFLF
jgi:hypothetical protein